MEAAQNPHQIEADNFVTRWSQQSHLPGKPEIERAARLAWDGHLKSVKYMNISSIDLGDIPCNQLVKLVSIVTEGMIIDNMTHANQLVILFSVKCTKLLITKMELSESNTQALVTAMRIRVKSVALLGVTLDIEKLIQYNGLGSCIEFRVYDQDTRRRYGDMLKGWAGADEKKWRVTLDNEEIGLFLHSMNPILDKIKENWTEEFYKPKLKEISEAALLAWEGYLDSVEYMEISEESITCVPRDHIMKLASIVNTRVCMHDMTHADQLSSILTSVQCPVLVLDTMELSEAETQALVTAMRGRVESVRLWSCTLDIDELTQYEGRGHCGELRALRDTRRRYRERLRGWAAEKRWTVTQDDDVGLGFERDPNTKNKATDSDIELKN